MLGEAFQGLGGAVIGAVGDLFGGHLGSQAAERRQDDAQTFSAQQFATRYQTTVKDMQAAGLNPMLAYSQGGGTAPSGTSAPGGDFGKPGTSFNQGRLSSAQAASVEAGIDNVRAETDRIKVDTQLKRAQMMKEESQVPFYGASADELRSRVNLQESQAKKIAEEIKNIPAEGDRIVAAAKMLGRQAALMHNQSLTEERRYEQIEQLARKTLLEANLLALDEKAANQLGNLGREFGQLKPVIDVILKLLRR